MTQNKSLSPEIEPLPEILAPLLRGTVSNYGVLQAARGAFEIHIAGLAAERRTTREMRRIEEALESVVADPIDADGIANTRLHRAISQAAHSPILSALHDVLLAQRTDCVQHTFYDAGVTPDWIVANDIHQGIVQAVRKKDTQAAQWFMARDMERAHQVGIHYGQQLWAAATADAIIALAQGT